MTEPAAFESRPDPELGVQLRAALDGPEPERFLARLRESVLQARRETAWDVLTRWAPTGLVAAAAAAAVLWLVLGPAAAPDPATRLIASAPARMEIAPGQAEADVLVSTIMEGR